MAGASAVERVVRAAIVPNTVSPDRLRGRPLADLGLYQLTQVVGPGGGGLLIAAFGVSVPYAVDAVSCFGMAAAAAALSPQPVDPGVVHEPVLRSIRSGLAFVRRQRPVMAGFVIDFCAMTFGMPRALFPVLSLTVYHAGASGTGLLYAAVAACGAFIALAGLVEEIWIAVALFALAGAADSVSAVCRSTMSQTLTPDAMPGRMSSVFSPVVASGPRLGDVESGTVAAIAAPAFSVVSGGLACLASVGLVAAFFPQLAAYDGDAISAGAVGEEKLELAAERLEAEELA